jgi:hypothetical protein
MQNGNGQKTWLVGGRTYSNFVEAVEAQDRRAVDFLRCTGIGEEELASLPKRVIPEGATPENYNPEPEWPISAAIDEALGKKFRLFTGPQLNTGPQLHSAQPETRYLIPGVLAAGRLGGIIGPFKTLKTSLAADLLISLASGTPFLGRFPVSQPGRVLFLSGEAGLPALTSIARRICAERGLSLDTLENFVCSPDVPKLGDPFDVMALTELVERERPVCVVIDPAFLALGGGRKSRGKKSRNLFEMGELLRPLAELCESTGCAVLVVDHCRQARKVGEPATLEDIAGSGLAEFSAQWLLVSRRRPFEIGTGHHELWLTTGSRAGDQGLWELDVDEGVAGLEPTGEPPVCGVLGAAKTPTPATRGWKTTLRNVSSLEMRTEERWVATHEDRQLRRRAIAFERQCQRTLELLSAYTQGRTARSIRDTLGMSGDRITHVLDWLIEKGQVIRIEDRIDSRRPLVTYERVQVIDLSGEAIAARRDTPLPDPKVYDVGTGHFVDRTESAKRRPLDLATQFGASTCPNIAEIRRAAAQRVRHPLAATVDAGSPDYLVAPPDSGPVTDQPTLPPRAESTTPESNPEMGRDTGFGSAPVASGVGCETKR